MSDSEIAKKQAAIVQEFERFSDWNEKYKHIISLGKALPPLADDLRNDDNRVFGCQSQVWLDAQLSGDRIVYQADSDAFIVKGLLALLLRVYSGEAPADIVAHPPVFLQEIGLQEHLSITRSNGLAKMIKKLQIYAVAFQSLMASQSQQSAS